MIYRKLGRSPLEVSLCGLGCNNFGQRIDLEATRRVVDKALDLGINFFDTADIYGNKGGSETFLGQSLGSRRKNIILATKFGMIMNEAGTMRGAARAYVMSACAASLRRLGTDWIDLYQLHRPDSRTPIEETLRALEDLIQQGKVRYIGCSNLQAWQVVEAEWTARNIGTHAFISCQDEYSLIVREPERELIPAMRAYGLALLPYFPLAGGFLTGKYKRGQPMPQGVRLNTAKHLADRYVTDANWEIVERLEKFCADRNRTLLELAIAWLAAQPLIPSVIAGATKPEQVEQNVRAVEWTLSADELAEVDRLASPSPKVEEVF
jgi:aryl-alcohol dehydrogenase-like predicted oxidoreductase